MAQRKTNFRSKENLVRNIDKMGNICICWKLEQGRIWYYYQKVSGGQKRAGRDYYTIQIRFYF